MSESVHIPSVSIVSMISSSSTVDVPMSCFVVLFSIPGLDAIDTGMLARMLDSLMTLPAMYTGSLPMPSILIMTPFNPGGTSTDVSSL